MKMLHMLIGCLALATLSDGQQDQNPPGFISIDCGVSSDYFDDEFKISYFTDANFVDSGTNKQISTQLMYENFWQQSRTMRIFPNGTRNCYTLRPDQGKGQKYLIRVSFWYGNYDGKNQTSIFDLHIDVNYWTTVNSTSFIHEEIIYTPPRDYIQVCLVNIGQGDPFVSTIELRPLNNSIYHIDSGALVNDRRYNLGSDDNYRHPKDDYDRIWAGRTFSNWSSINNTAILTSTSNDDYKVPREVLMTAEQVQNVNDSLSLHWTPNNSSTTWYVYLHFVELQQAIGQFRELVTYVEDKYVGSIILGNLKPATVASPPFTGSYPSVTIDATARSDLPPMLNAYERFHVLELPYSPTILDDFNAMYDIKRTYEVARTSWQGDPCVPSQFAWSGVNCSYGDLPRIVSLNLSSTGLKGPVVASFSNLTALVSLDLSNNQLTGLIPDFFAQMPSLTSLNLSQNNFNGLVPQALLNKKADASLQLSLEGNQNLCQSNSCPTKKKSTNVAAKIASFAAIALVIAFLTALIVFWRIKRGHNHEVAETITSPGSNQSLKRRKNRPFASAEVTRITNNFKTVIGEGAFGKVYLGHLDDGDQGKQVAVKLLSRSSKQGYKEFHAEVKQLMVIHHKNLVSLIGYCEEPEYMALIYEFMSKGNVRENLSEYNPNALSWMQRLHIAIDAAQGLEYLHNGCKPSIIHRDLKTLNILLNENMQAKIADFGLSKAVVTNLDSHISTYPAGTPGYLDPEFHTLGTLSQKSDVYSFGVILFELITGHPAIIRSEKGNIHILDWVTPLIERGDIGRIIDLRLKGQFTTSSAWKSVEIAMSCVSTKAVQRPDMDRVVSELKECLATQISFGSSQRIGSWKKQNNSIEMISSEIDMVPNAR